MEYFRWGLYLIWPVMLAVMILAGKKYTGEDWGSCRGLDRAAALVYEILRKGGPFPGEKDVYRAQTLLDAGMGAQERTRQWYLIKFRILLLFFLSADLIAAAVHLSAVRSRELQEGGVILRNTYGGADKELDLEAGLIIPGERDQEKLGEYHLRVQARRYTRKEAEAMAENVMETLPGLILGDNEGWDRIWQDLYLPGALQGFPFRISWKSSFYALIDTDGRVFWENLSEPLGEEVTVTAVLSYAPWTFEKDIPLRVVKPPAAEPLSRRDTLARMLEAGEDPLYVARRVLRFASEDIGLADPRAMEIGVAAYQACHFIGMPECTVNLTEAVVYMSMAPKSNSMEKAYMMAAADASKMLAEPVPLNIRNGVTKLMREVGYGAGYKYAHDYEGHITSMQCLPDSLLGREYFVPSENGLEAKYKERLKQIKEWKAAHKDD